MKRSTEKSLATHDPATRLRRIDSLTLETDYREITQLFYADFRSSMVAKSINGFMMNYASPRISRLLASTGQLEHRIAKRVVDTIALSSLVMRNGLEGEGRDAARRVNAMHRRYDIHPDDYLAVGAEEVVDSIALAERYGWRSVTDKEREALNLYYSHQTRAFGSSVPLPPCYAQTCALYEDYLNREIRYEPQNERLAKILIAWLGTLAPLPLRPLYRATLVAQLDVRIARACGIQPALPPIKAMAHALLKHLGKKDPLPDSGSNHLENLVRRVYPNGYSISDLGT